MIIVDAVWEKRNIGLETKEISIEANDIIEEVSVFLKSIQTEYIVVKTPTMRTDVSFLLSQLGYTYIESMLRVGHTAESSSIPKEKMNLLNRIEIYETTEQDIGEVLALIENGLFHTDRIALDPYFSRYIANRRYACWIQDEIAAGTVLWNFKLDGERYGFAAAKLRPNHVCHIVLYGIDPKFQGRGLAYTIAQKIEAQYLKKGVTCFTTDISTNNPASLKGFLRSGFTVEHITNVFVKHNLPREEYISRLTNT